MSIVLHGGSLPAYVGAPLSATAVFCIVAFVFFFRDTIVTGVGNTAGQTIRLSWWTARKLKKLLESKPDQVGAWNAWKCGHCKAMSEFKDVGVYCVKQNNGQINYFLEGVCTRTNLKWNRFINKGDLATAGVRVNLVPRLAKDPAPPPKTWISPKVKRTTSTSRFGGSMVTGFGIGKDVAEKMEAEWPTMGDFAAAQKQELKAWKNANSVHQASSKLWFAATEMKKHLASQARPKSSPAKS